MNRFPTDTKLCCKILGTAIADILPSIGNENFLYLPDFILLILLSITTNAKIEDMPCAINVAHATPATFMSIGTTNTISKMIFPTDDAIRKYSGVLLSPRAVKTPVHMLYRNRKISPPVYI